MTDSLFVNISNHPSDLWCREQKDAALALCAALSDLPFPAVPPEATKAHVAAMASDVAGRLRSLAAGRRVVAHVMGEMSLTFALVSLLKAEGVTCVASSTERAVEVLPDGRKASSFRFVLFREY